MSENTKPVFEMVVDALESADATASAKLAKLEADLESAQWVAASAQWVAAEWHKKCAEARAERDTARKEFGRMTEAADSWRAKYMEAVADPAELATLRRERDEALAAVEEWRQLAVRHETQAGAWFSETQAEKRAREMLANDLAKCGEELASARAENVRLHNRVNALCDTDRNAARLVAMIADRDRAIAERNEARKALASYCSDSATLRARVAELEAEKGWSLGVKKFVAADGTQYSVAEYVEFLLGRIAELEATIETRDKRVEYLSSSIHAIQSLVDSV